MPEDSQLPAILLIEKDELTLEIYQRELSKSFCVYASTRIDTALETLATHDIRALIIEPEIRSGQGWQLMEAIHEVIQDRSIPVIVCSTRDPDHENQLRGIAIYLTKPVLPRTLRLKIQDILEAHGEQAKES